MRYRLPIGDMFDKLQTHHFKNINLSFDFRELLPRNAVDTGRYPKARREQSPFPIILLETTTFLIALGSGKNWTQKRNRQDEARKQGGQ